MLRDHAISQKGDAVTVGGSDEGRSGLVQHPNTREMTVVCPKVSAWTGNNTYPAIAEYKSDDLGGTWTFAATHEIA